MYVVARDTRERRSNCDVENTMVAGEFLMRGKKVLKLNVDKILKNANDFIGYI